MASRIVLPVRWALRAVCLAAGVAVCLDASSPPVQTAREFKDVTYATVDGKALALDLYLPAGVAQPPLVVWVHGGAWRQGSKASVPLGFVRNGIATASVDYRLSPEARFPGMIHDIKAAVRFLRARAGEYGYRTDRIAIAGDSAGGHLAALVGVSNGVAALEGTVGAHTTQSSNIQAIVDYYGATNLTTILSQSTPLGLDVRRPALELLLGALPDKAPELATLASVVSHVDASDPALLIFHGDRDPQMPINQSHELEGVYEKSKLDVEMIVVHGSGHGGSEFYEGTHLDRAVSFLRRTLTGNAP